MEPLWPSTTASVKAFPMCISTSCLAIARTASKASFGPDNGTRMMLPSDRCRKRFSLPLQGFDLPDIPRGRFASKQDASGCRFSWCPSGKGRQRQWYNRMGGMCKPVRERFALPMKHSHIRQSTNNREKDVRMNASSETWQLGNQSVQVTHLEKVYWPQAGFTKGDMLRYYVQIAPVALPYLKDRPVTLRVYPQGVEGASYYLRDCPEEAPDWLRRVDYQPKTVSHPVPLPVIDTVADLLWFSNQGAIEFHLWGSHTPDLSQPDLAIFDLDRKSTRL